MCTFKSTSTIFKLGSLRPLLLTILIIILVNWCETSNGKSTSNGYVAEWEYHKENFDHELLPQDVSQPLSMRLQHHDSSRLLQNDVELPQSPSSRVDPAVWQDSNGSWWLYGGRRVLHNSNSKEGEGRDKNRNKEFLSDLWVYENVLQNDSSSSSQDYKWRLVFDGNKKEKDDDVDDNNNVVSSSYPRNIISPILCGSTTQGRIAIFGSSNFSQQQSTSSSSSSETSFFSDDNLVWIYEIPQHKSEESNHKGNNEGVWTSYICCDLCDPEFPVENRANTTSLQFCPHFSTNLIQSSKDNDDDDGKNPNFYHHYIMTKEEEGEDHEEEDNHEFSKSHRKILQEPILWCAQDSLMALQLTFTKSQNSVSQVILADDSPAAKSKRSRRSSSSSSFTSSSNKKVFTTKNKKEDEHDDDGESSTKNLHKVKVEKEIESHTTTTPHNYAFTTTTTFPSSKIHLRKLNTIPSSLDDSSSFTTANNKEMKKLINKFKTTTTPTSSSSLNSIITTTTESNTNSQRIFKPPSSESNSLHLKISSKDKNVLPSSSSGGGNTSSGLKMSSKKKKVRSPQKESPEIKNYLNWWKFNLVSTEWEKLPQVFLSNAELKSNDELENEVDDDDKNNNNKEELVYKLFDKNYCRSTTDSVFVYILCLPFHDDQQQHHDESLEQEASSVQRNVFVFDPVKSNIVRLSSTIQLNNAFHDSILWTSSSHSILHALRMYELNKTLLFIAYNKLIDFWIHDHTTGNLFPAENIWKGSTLDLFQHHDSFYKLKIKFGNISKKSWIVFLLNPRHTTTTSTESLIFDESNNFEEDEGDSDSSSSSSGWFNINIESDENIFLPSRDTSFMINIEQEEEMEKENVKEDFPSTTATTMATTTTTAANLVAEGTNNMIELNSSKSNSYNNNNPTTVTTTTSTESTTTTTTEFITTKITTTTTSSTTTPSPPLATTLQTNLPAAASFLKVEPLSPQEFPNDTKEKIQFHLGFQVQLPESLLVNTSTSTTTNETHYEIIGIFNFASPSFNLSLANGKLKRSSSSNNVASRLDEKNKMIEKNASMRIGSNKKNTNNVISSQSSVLSMEQNKGIKHNNNIASNFDKKSGALNIDSSKSAEVEQLLEPFSQALKHEKLYTSQEAYLISTNQHHDDDNTIQDEEKVENLFTTSTLPIQHSGSAAEHMDKDNNTSTINYTSTSATTQNEDKSLSSNDENINSSPYLISSLIASSSSVVDNFSVSDTNFDSGTTNNNNNDNNAAAAAAFNSRYDRVNNEEDYNFANNNNNNNNFSEGDAAFEFEDEYTEEFSSSYSYTSIIFYTLSISIFAIIGIVFFIRTCVKCPNNNLQKDENDVFSEPGGLTAPSMRFSAMRSPDDFYLNTPIV